MGLKNCPLEQGQFHVVAFHLAGTEQQLFLCLGKDAGWEKGQHLQG